MINIASLNSYQVTKTVPPLTYFDNISSNTFSNDISSNNILGSYTVFKLPVKCATTTEIDLKAGEMTIDGIDVVFGDRVLVKNQVGEDNGQIDNGIYIVNQTWYRAYDLPAGISPVGVIVYVADGVSNKNTFFYCDALFTDTVGTSLISFYPLRGISNGPLNSVQYNFPNGIFHGSSSFTYDNDNTTLTIGSESKTTVIQNSNTNSTYPNHYLLIKTDDAVDEPSGDLIVQSGFRGLNEDTITPTTDGSITISTVGTSPYIGQVAITTSSSTGTGSGGDILFKTGLNGGNINISSGYTDFITASINFVKFTSESVINITTSGIETVVESGGLTFTKGTDTVANFGTSPEINAKQGTITITDPSSLGAGSSISLVVNNNMVSTSSIVITSINSYAGTGSPIVEVIDKVNSTSFTLMIANIDSVTLSNSPLLIDYILF